VDKAVGKWKGKSFTGGGRSKVPTALFMAALVASRYNLILKAFRDRLVDAGKPKIVAIVATMRNCLPFSTPSSGIKRHGKTLDEQDSRSLLFYQLRR
jgi:hypothetical protein